MTEDEVLRRDIRRKPGVWAFIATAALALVVAFLFGDALDPFSPAARSERFDFAFLNCLDVQSEKFPDGLYREDIGHHYDPEGLCFLIAAHMGGEAFQVNWSDPAYVELVRNTEGE